jgi:hypothetical protein
VRFGERRGLIMLGFGEDRMVVLNSPGFAPREFYDAVDDEIIWRAIHDNLPALDAQLAGALA